MDELSLGVALITEQSCVRAELLNLFEHTAEDEGVASLRRTVWVKAPYVLGKQVPVFRSASPQFNRLMQKTSIDTLWNMSIAEFIQHDSGVRSISQDFETSAARINLGKVKYAHEIKSIQQAFVAEIGGALAVFKDDIATLLLDLYKRKTGVSVSATDEEIEKFADKIQTVLVNSFRFAPRKMAQRIPTLYVYTMCHAAMRWDKNRKFDGHWLLDIHHASAGVGYHDAIFTENPLRVLLTSGNVALDREYGVRILLDERDVICYLTELR